MWAGRSGVRSANSSLSCPPSDRRMEPALDGISVLRRKAEGSVVRAALSGSRGRGSREAVLPTLTICDTSPLKSENDVPASEGTLPATQQLRRCCKAPLLTGKSQDSD